LDKPLLRLEAFNALPKFRRLVIIDSYSDSNDIIISSINKFANKISADRTKLILNEKLQLVMEEPHYNEGK